MSNDNLSATDKDFLAKCEEELKHRFTELDEEYMKVFNSDSSTPPIMDPWWVSYNSGRRNDRRNNRRSHPYERPGRGRDYGRRDNFERRDYESRDSRGNYEQRGYNDYENRERDQGYNRHRY